MINFFDQLSVHIINKKLLEIESINTTNPTEFWKQISSLGPKRPHKIPLQVYDEDSPVPGNKTSEVGKVLQSWKSDFQGLYNIPDDETSMFDNEFYNQIKSELTNIKELE